MTKNIIISADSTSDIPPYLIEKYDIKILPLYINLGENSYRDGVDITPSDIVKFVEENDILPTTSSVTPAAFHDFFSEMSPKYDSVIHFSISSDFSSAYQNAYLTSQEFSNVHVVDTRGLSIGEALLIIKACELVEQGKQIDEILEYCEYYKSKIKSSFVIDNLEYLSKGGRCSPVLALGANLLQIKPTIEVIDGKMDVGRKYRGKFNSIVAKYVADQLNGAVPIDGRIFIDHTICPQEYIDIATKEVKESGLFSEIIYAEAGCTIFSHCGPNTLGIMFASEN